jgi:hypothetical protein
LVLPGNSYWKPGYEYMNIEDWLAGNIVYTVKVKVK